MKKQGHSQNLTSICELTRQIRRSIREDKNSFLQSKCEEIEKHKHENKPKAFFRAIIGLTKKPDNKIACINDEVGNILTEAADVLDRWIRYCKSLYEADILITLLLKSLYATQMATVQIENSYSDCFQMDKRLDKVVLSHHIFLTYMVNE